MSFLSDLVMLVLVAAIIVGIFSYLKRRKEKNKLSSDDGDSTATQVLELDDANPIANSKDDSRNGRQSSSQALPFQQSGSIDHGLALESDSSSDYLDEVFEPDSMPAVESEPADTPMSYAELQIVQSPDMDNGQGDFHQLYNFPYMIGRTQGDLCINDKRISGKHATITLSDGRYYIIDTDSKNGVFIDGQRINSLIPAPLPMGQTVKISLGSATHFTFIGH